MATELIVANAFPGYAKGQVIVDPVAISAILAGPYSDQVRSIIPTTSGSAGGNSIIGVPSAIQINTAVAGSYTALLPGCFVCVRLAGTDILPRVALPFTSGALPTISAPSAGTGTIAMYATATGGTPLFETGAIVFTLAAQTGIVLPPNALLLGTDAYGVPTVITLGNGLSLINGVLTLTGSVVITPPANSNHILLRDGTSRFLLRSGAFLTYR